MSVSGLYGLFQRYQPAPAGPPGGPHVRQWPSTPLLLVDRRRRSEPDTSRAGTMHPGPTGREAEVAEISAFLPASAGTPSAVAIAGDIGIGKTVVWQHVVEAARTDCRVLSCCPVQAESPLAFSALDDLFGGVIEEVLAELPEARRQAVGAVLLHGRPELPGADPGHPEPERRLLARGTLDV